MLDWIKIHYEKPENQVSMILDNKTAYFTDECVEEKFSFYWDTVIGLVLQGNVDMVRMLLCSHSQRDTDPFIQAVKIFKSMPTYSVSIIHFYLITYIMNYCVSYLFIIIDKCFILILLYFNIFLMLKTYFCIIIMKTH